MLRKHTQLLITILSASFLPLCLSSNTVSDDSVVSNEAVHFEEALDDFPREEKNLRKWDAPVVADLDQDGFVDLLLNDHGFGVRICWNNKGKFAKPYDLIMGDLHGISIGDIDRDGNHEIVISRGGGAGENARNAKIFRVTHQREFTEVPELALPLQRMRGRTVKLFDGDKDGDLDLLNFAFPSRENKGTSENYVYRNDGSGHFELTDTLPPVKQDGQKTLLTDINGDGVVDLLLYGNDRVRAFQGRGDLSFEEVTDAVIPVIKHVTCIVEIDYDNDGDFDLFLTRGQEFEAGETFYDEATHTWGFFTKRGPFRFEDLAVGDVLNIENLQSQWPHKQLYLGESAYEYEFPGETHSGRDVRMVNSDALGWPDSIDKKGTYLGYVGNNKWRLAGDMWAPSSGIVRGVKFYEKYDHPPGPGDILLENREGAYVDVSKRLNLHSNQHTTGAAVADFDNDGYSDLVIIRRGDLVHTNSAIVCLNQGGTEFTPLARHQIASSELGAIGLGVETLDYNRDGRVDILTGDERGKWHLYRNQSSTGNNYVQIDVAESPTGAASALGATASIKYGDRKKVCRVGSSGAAYSRSLNPSIHFGIGEDEGPVEVRVNWTNGKILNSSISKVNSRFETDKPAQ